MWLKSKPKKELNNNRFRFILTIIFLLSLALIVQLVRFQILQHKDYVEIASRQHQLSAEIKPERGKIYVNDIQNGETTLFPWATNKDYAEVFFVPKDATNITGLAEKVYNVFNKEKVEADVKQYFADLNEQELESLNQETDPVKKEEMTQRINNAKASQNSQELQQIKYDLELNRQKQVIIESYLTKLRKTDDPYEPIDRQVPSEKLLELFAALLSTETESIDPANLELKNGEIYRRDNGEEALSFSGVDFNLTPYRYYPDGTISSQLLGFVNIIDDEEKGNYGLEEFFNNELFGEYGSVKGEKGAGSLVIANQREYVKSKKGADLVLTIDRSAQILICQKLEEAVTRFKIDSGTIIVVEPKTGAILAMCSYPSFNPNDYKSVASIDLYNNPALLYQYEPGSTFKTITMSAAIDQNKVNPNTTYEDRGSIMIKGWPKAISNSDYASFGAHGVTTMSQVLEMSLNTGAIFAAQQVGANIFSDYVQNYNFGQTTGIELGAESTGNIENLLVKKIKEIDVATASFGQGIAVTPLQMVMAYASLANGGLLMKPYIVQEIVYEDGTKDVTSPQPVRQVVSAKTADTISAMLVNVVENGHSKKAAVPGYYIGGKTGTAQVVSETGGYSTDKYIHSFLGIAPVDNPKFVVIVKLDNPKGFKFAESTAAPIFGEIADFLLKYYKVPKER
jgi:cell division protein FtsI/penicillin-binding protein 2